MKILKKTKEKDECCNAFPKSGEIYMGGLKIREVAWSVNVDSREGTSRQSCVCVCVCVCVRERESECVCVCVCVRERDGERERECVCV